MQEKDLYPEVQKWLQTYLESRHKTAEIRVFDSSMKSLEKIISENNLFNKLPPEWHSWDIHVDVVGFIISAKTTELAFVECKMKQITLANLSQLLDYCKVANPKYSFLLSPAGISGTLNSLINSYARRDILTYMENKGEKPRAIIVAKWDSSLKSLDLSSIIQNK